MELMTNIVQDSRKKAWSRILFVDPLNFWYWLQKGRQRYRILHWIWTETIQLCNYPNNKIHPTPKVRRFEYLNTYIKYLNTFRTSNWYGNV